MYNKYKPRNRFVFLVFGRNDFMSKNGFMSKYFKKFTKPKSDEIDEENVISLQATVNHFGNIETHGKKIISLSRKIQRDINKIQKIARIINKNIGGKNKIKYLTKADNITNKINENLENLQKSFKDLDDTREFMRLDRNFINNCTELNFTKIFPPGQEVL